MINWASWKLKKYAIQNTYFRKWKDMPDWKNIHNTLCEGPSMQNKELLYRNNNKPTQFLKTKWIKDLKRHFTKEKRVMTNKHLKRCSTTFYEEKCKMNPQKFWLHTHKMTKLSNWHHQLLVGVSNDNTPLQNYWAVS